MESKVLNSKFDKNKGLDRGRSFFIESLWYFIKIIFFLSPLPWPSFLKCTILKLFGADIGNNVNIKPRVNIHFPWKLAIGDYSWIGEEVFILNFEKVSIGANCCISQRVFLCSGNHDYRDPAMSFRNGIISIEDGVWIGAQVFVAPNLRISCDAVITAGSVVTNSIPEAMICTGNPCKPLRARW